MEKLKTLLLKSGVISSFQRTLIALTLAKHAPNIRVRMHQKNSKQLVDDVIKRGYERMKNLQFPSYLRKNNLTYSNLNPQENKIFNGLKAEITNYRNLVDQDEQTQAKIEQNINELIMSTIEQIKRIRGNDLIANNNRQAKILELTSQIIMLRVKYLDELEMNKLISDYNFENGKNFLESEAFIEAFDKFNETEGKFRLYAKTLAKIELLIRKINQVINKRDNI